MNTQNVVSLRVGIENSCTLRLVLPIDPNKDNRRFIGSGYMCMLHGFHINAGEDGNTFVTYCALPASKGFKPNNDISIRSPDSSVVTLKDIPNEILCDVAHVLTRDPELLALAIKEGYLTPEIGHATIMYILSKKPEDV